MAEILMILGFIVGLAFGKTWSDRIWKEAFKKWTEETYANYKRNLERINKKS